MGLRYRKSIRLGGGFRVNISKSGIGYSWGFKGYRVTKTAKGTTRRTASIPGTGLSYVEETGNSKTQPKPIPNADSNHYDTQNIENATATGMVSAGVESILSKVRRIKRLRKISFICCILSILIATDISGFAIPAIIFGLLYIYIRLFGRVRLNYTIDSEMQSSVDSCLDPFVKISKSKKIWRITQTAKVINSKTSYGAGSSIIRKECSASTKVPFPFKVKGAKAVSFKLDRKETLLFLPDKLFIIQRNKIGALSYDDVSTVATPTRFIEDKAVPKDTEIVDYAWQYANKNGGPDSRFKNNRHLPVCRYGELEVKSPSGLNTVIMFSNFKELMNS